MAKKYLYGAAVQGIQGFIFATNELKDIVGASELVSQICTSFFDEFRGKPVNDNGVEYEKGFSVIKAAGNIKFIFNREDDCKEAVLRFPKKVLTEAPGITISQAVVELGDDSNDAFKKAVDELEAKLRACRNRQPKSVTLGLMAIERSRQTGLPVVRHDDGTPRDAATLRKRMFTPPANQSLSIDNFGQEIRCSNISRFTKPGNPWIAVIHIDGNGLGQVVAKVGSDKLKFSKFSLALDRACKAAALEAFHSVQKDYGLELKDDRLPMRPIVLSGDDHTIFCRADLAIPYVKQFLELFEHLTRKMIDSDVLESAGYTNPNAGLTACAGIAFIKANYPFYYGYNLAESLCSEAKKDAKRQEFTAANGNLAPSCLMFHKVQDSFVEEFADVKERELTPAPGKSWCAGPYYLHSDFAEGHNRLSIDDLTADSRYLDGHGSDAPDAKTANAIKSSLRQWLSAMHSDPEMAKQMRKRLLEIHRHDSEQIKKMTNAVGRDNIDVFRAYDVLSLHSVSYGD